MGSDDDIELFQVIGTDTQTAVELEMIKHDGDTDNVEENADLDIFIINTDLDTISSSAGLDRFEYAQIPADPGEYFT